MVRELGPAYKHFDKISESILPNLEKFKCRYCAAEYLRNHTKMLNHLRRQCKRVPEFIKQELSKVTAPASDTKDAIASTSKTTKESTVPVIPHQSASLASFLDSMSSNEQDELEKYLARAIYSSGSASSIFESEDWKQFFTRLRPSFKLPGRFKVGGSLLDEEYSRMVNKVDGAINASKFLSIQCDAWTNIRSESIINVIVSTPTPYLYESISTGSESHDGDFYCQKISEIIEKVGPKKVIGFVTDNASVMKKSWRLLTLKYPHLVTFGCCAHGLNLLCKDIMNIPRLRKLEKLANSIVKSFKKSALLSGRIKELSAQEGSEKIELKLSNKTRWVSTLLSFTSLLKSKSIIRQIAVDAKYEASLGRQKVSDILSAQFWDELKETSEIMKPIAKWIIIGTFKLIQSTKRNRLTNERAGKLVFLCHNLKLEKTVQQNRLEEPLNYLGIQFEPQQLQVDSDSSFSNLSEDIAPVEECDLESMNDEDENAEDSGTVAEDSTPDPSGDYEAEEEILSDLDEEEVDEIAELYRLATSPNYLFNI